MSVIDGFEASVHEFLVADIYTMLGIFKDYGALRIILPTCWLDSIKACASAA
jgi:hypothetical protein